MISQRDNVIGNESLHPGLIERTQQSRFEVNAFLTQAIAQPLQRGTGVVEQLAVVGQRLQERVGEFLADLRVRLHSEKAELLKRIEDSGKLSDEDEEELGAAIKDFVDDFGADFDEHGDPIEAGESDRIKSPEERQAPARTAEDSSGDAKEATPA